MKRPVASKKRVRRTPKSKLRSFQNSKIGTILLGSLCLLFLVGIAYHYRSGLAYYFGFKSTKIIDSVEAKRFSDVRNFQVLSKYEDKVVGFDVSEYQGTINWNEVRVVENTFPLRFVFIRATAGKDKIDTQFDFNWVQAQKNKLICGAYHYYRPNENSKEQAFNFIKKARLKKGNLPPILDIESMPRNQSVDSLKVGLKRWLEIVDAHYKARPIIYTNAKFYETFLKEDFKEYTFWIANYNFFVEEMQDDWLFWQFTEKATVSGIKGSVDLSIYNGTPKMLNYLTIN